MQSTIPVIQFISPQGQPLESGETVQAQGLYMLEFIRRLWPSIAQYMGDKFKAKFRARDIVIDSVVDEMVEQLTKNPMGLPIRASWLNTIVEIMWPVIRAGVNKMIHVRVLPSIIAKLPSFLQSIDVNPCSLGTKAPRIVPPIKVNEHGVNGGGMMLEVEIEYEGDADIEVAFKGSSVGVKEITFRATFFIQISGMHPRPPFFRGLSMFMCKPCDFGLKWAGLLQHLDLNSVEDIIRKELQDILGGMFLLPNRYGYVYDPTVCNVFDIKRPKPIGCLQITLLKAEQLVGVEYDVRTFFTGELNTDPFVTIRVGSESWRSGTVWHTTNPEWDEDNVHIFQVDAPEKQHVRIHVWDDGLVQSLKAKAVGDGAESESDEVARSVNLTVHDLLGKPPGQPLSEEVILERWIDLDSWWASRDKYFNEQHPSNQAGAEQQEEEASSFFQSPMQWARQKLQWARHTMDERRSRLDLEHRNTLLQAKARLKLHVHWRPLTYGTRMALPPQHHAVAAAAPQQTVLQMPPRVVYYSGNASQRSVPMGVPQPLAVSNWPAYGTAMQTRPMTYPQGVYPQGVVYQTSLAPIPQGGKRRKKKGGSSSSSSSDDGEGSSNGSSSSSSSSSSSGSESSATWCGWPSFALRVGITILEKLPCLEQDLTTRFFVTCVALPVVNGDCREVTEKTKNVTTKTSGKRYPLTRATAAQTQRVSQLMHLEDYLIRKIGLLLQKGMAVDTIADVLDIDHATVKKHREAALIEMTGRRDVIVDEAFIYYIRDPSVVEVRLEVFKEELKKEPVSVGSVSLKVGALLYREEMTEELMRLPLDVVDEEALAARLAAGNRLNAVEEASDPPLKKERFSKISAHCQLWPIATKCAPHIARLGEGASQNRDLKEDGHASQKLATAVTVYSASDLRNVDMFGGKSDPYVICTLWNGVKSKKLFQTKVIDNDPDPVWMHPPETVKWGSDKCIKFTVYDKDFLSKGDMLGEVSVMREECKNGLFTDLNLGEGNGTLRVKIAPMNGGTAKDVPFSAPTPLPRIALWIMYAEDLHSSHKADAGMYVVCKVSEHQNFKTKPVADGVHPRWEHGPEVLTWGDQKEISFTLKERGLFSHHSVGVLSREVCLKGYVGPVPLGQGGGNLHVKVESLPPLDGPTPLKLEISVISAKDLRNADMFSKSDPFVVCKLKGKEKFRTSIIWDNHNPVWNHGPEVVLLLRDKEVLFEVYDKDVVGTELLGRASVDRHVCENGFDGHLDLGRGNGSLHVYIAPQKDTNLDDQAATPSDANAQGAELAVRHALPPMDAEHIGAWVEMARGMAARMVSLMMQHIPKCGGK